MDMDEELGENNHVPHSLEVFCSSPVESLRRFWAKPFDGITLPLLFVMCAEWVDTAQTLSLFPLSWLVITNSGGVIDVLVNVVAVSVFATLDDEVVELFTKPQQSLLDRWRLYSGSAEDLTRSGIIDIKPMTD
jgi:hypothetical protein